MTRPDRLAPLRGAVVSDLLVVFLLSNDGRYESHGYADVPDSGALVDSAMLRREGPAKSRSLCFPGPTNEVPLTTANEPSRVITELPAIFSRKAAD